MIWPFKRKWNCRHFKKVGEPFPENMKSVLRFSPYKKDTIGYGINECTECGKRAFSCIGYHFMGPTITDAVDAFINHKIELEELLKTFDEYAYWYRLTEKETP